MKRVLILHGTDDNSSKNWFPWLSDELKLLDLDVWVPDLPDSNKPNIQKYNNFLFRNQSWIFDRDTILIGHSSGAVATLGILQNLPDSQKVDTCILVGAFKDDLGWESLQELFINEFDFELIKSKAKKFVFIHSDNDPYCPLEGAQFLAERLSGELIILPGQGHFSTGRNPEYTKFPYLLNLIKRLYKH
jgi:predicted alpha/beta hydrolase family esterase